MNVFDFWTYLRPDIVPPHVPVHHNYNKNYLIVAFVSFGVAVVVVAAAVVAAVGDVAVVVVDDSFVAGMDAVHVGTAEKETQADYSSIGLALK